MRAGTGGPGLPQCLLDAGFEERDQLQHGAHASLGLAPGGQDLLPQHLLHSQAARHLVQVPLQSHGRLAARGRCGRQGGPVTPEASEPVLNFHFQESLPTLVPVSRADHPPKQNTVLQAKVLKSLPHHLRRNAWGSPCPCPRP